MFMYLNRFHQYAVKHNLSAAAILLWQYLYLRMVGRNQFERFHLDTAVLMQMLQITRQGLIGVRKSLEQAGLLAVEQDESQRLWYTLQLDGQALQPVVEEAQPATDQPNETAEQTMNELPALQSEQACCAFTDDEQEAGAAALGSVRDEKNQSSGDCDDAAIGIEQYAFGGQLSQQARSRRRYRHGPRLSSLSQSLLQPL